MPESGSDSPPNSPETRGALTAGAFSGLGWVALQVPHAADGASQWTRKPQSTATRKLEFALAAVTLGAMGYSLHSYRQEARQRSSNNSAPSR